MDGGRFLKKRVAEKLEGLEIENFSFCSLTPDDIALTDNPRRSLIYSKLHTREELERKVQKAPIFSQVLRPRNPAIIPTDLTQDYQRSQEELVIKKRRKLLDEDEAVALELAEMMEKNASTLVGWRAKGDVETGPSQDADAKEPTPEASKATASAAREPQSPMKIVADAIKASKAAEAAADEAQEAVREAAPAAEVFTGQASLSDEELEALRAEAWQKAYEEGFAQGRAEGATKGAEEAREAGFHQGQTQGYEEGFREGEVRGEFAGEAKVSKTLDLLAEVVRQLDLLRSEIVASGQDIFIEFTKAACEGILRAQLASHDDTLRRFLIQTMKPFVERSFLVLEVHPSEAARVASLLADRPELAKKARVKENPDIVRGDFRVEADNEVVVVDLHRAVSAFIDEIKSDILSSTVETHKESA